MTPVVLKSPNGGETGGFSPNLVDWTDAELLRDSSNPAEAFAVFYRRHVDALIRFAAGRGITADLAADVVSETFLAALKGRQAYRPERDHARLWLLGIASRRIADVHRRRASEGRRNQRLRGEVIVLTQTDQDSYDQLGHGNGRMLDALADLPTHQQDVLRARILEDRGYTEIAEMFGRFRTRSASTRQPWSRRPPTETEEGSA